MPIPVFNRLGSLLSYQHYLSFQAASRDQRRESILICEHLPTITLGVQTDPSSILSSPEVLLEKGIERQTIGRGGDVTAHEPGQIVFYVHADLRKRAIHLTEFFKMLLFSAASSLETVFSIQSKNISDMPGLYVNDEKLVSIGVEFRSFFTSHGIAVNFENSLETFRHIRPCGYDRNMTSVKFLTGEISRLKKDLFLDLVVAGVQSSLEKTL